MLWVAAFSLAGCSGKPATVSGRVTLDQKPLTSGNVVFNRQGEATAVGQIGSDGQYSVCTGAARGMEPGAYQVTISAYKTQPSADGMAEPIYQLLTPAKYNRPETSGLSAEIVPGSNTLDFDLHSN